MNPQLVMALRQRYEAALISGDSAGAVAVVDQALATPDFTLGQFFAEILAPAQRSLELQWLGGHIGAVEGQRGTNITLEQLVRLRQVLKPRERLRRKAMIFAVGREGDGLGGRMLADLLYWDGWDVDFLGCNLPGQEAASYASKSQVDLVAIALWTAEGTSLATDAINKLKLLEPRPKVLVGGLGPVAEVADRGGAAVDAVVEDLRKVTECARRLVGLSRGSAVLEEVLRSVGERLRAARKQRGLSQQEVSDRCTLDRAYLSELENGKQNATIGALIKVTSALDISLRDLFS